MTKRRDISEKEKVQPGNSGEVKVEAHAFTQLQSHYLGSLDRLINLKNSYLADPSCEQWLVKAIDKATYSAFRSCVENGVEHEAKNLLTAERRSN